MIFAALISGAAVASAFIVLLLITATLGDSTIYVVAYSNYQPAEVDSVWFSEAKAKMRAEELGDPWEVAKWKIKA